MQLDTKLKVKYVDFSKEYLSAIVALAEERLGQRYTTEEKLQAFIQDKTTACKLIVSEKDKKLQGFLFSHSSDIPSLAAEMKLTPEEIETLLEQIGRISAGGYSWLQNDADSYVLADLHDSNVTRCQTPPVLSTRAS